MSRDIFESPEELIGKLAQKVQELSTATVLFHQNVAQKLGLNPTDHKCLDLIMRNENMTAGYLAQMTGLTTGAITGVIDRLEKKGLVRRERDLKDRRKIVVVANKEKAYQELAPYFSSLGNSMNELFKTYSVNELETIYDFVSKSIGILQKESKI